MTLEELEQVKYKKREIVLITEKITNLYNTVEMTSDTVQGSSKAAPYVKHTITITGVDVIAVNRVRRRVEKLKNRKKILEADVDMVEDFVEDIADSQLRQIIELKYLMGLNWNMVASRVYGYPNGNRARMKIERFFKNN